MDPYKDFKKQYNYSWKYFFQSLGDISTKKLLNSKLDYNTFIFGSSRTTGLFACYVQKKIKKSKVFHYANWNETIGGISEKIKLIDQLGYDIENIIIYIDTDYTFEGDGKCQPYDHYLLTHKQELEYQFSHFKGFFSDIKNLKILFGYNPSTGLFPNRTSDINTNDSYHNCSDSIINAYEHMVTTEDDKKKIDSMIKIGFMYNRPLTQEYKEKQISNNEIEYIKDIIRIKNKHNTKIYVVITPLYDQLKFDHKDFSLLQKYFGKSSIYDFSGINSYTNDPLNFPDRKHFVPSISKHILDSIIK
jgi:hypothetical protein